MANKILVFVEQRDNLIKKSSLEAANLAAELAKNHGGDLEAIVIGNDVEEVTKPGEMRVKKILHFKSPDLQHYSPTAYRDLVVEYAKESGANILIFSNTALGKDLAPRVAVKLNAGIAVDCISFKQDGDDIVTSRPVYGGKAIIDIKLNSEIKVFTLRPNVFQIEETGENNAELEVREVSGPNLNTKVVDLKKAEGKIDVAEATRIVSGGRGLKGPEHFHLIETLAQQLNAAVGASRAVVDAGWRPHSEQVGQTGKTVSPTLYVAVGISGAIQHLAGMRSSKYIVAINKDKDAPIFQVADYGIVGDLFEVVPALIEELKKVS